jgi:predicted SnoaL-like aldol condensation-catalyzing enzyme
MIKLKFWLVLATVLNLSACGTGDTGPAGAMGATGEAGAIGSPGEAGATGEAGAAGTTSCENVGCEFVNKLVVEQIYNDVINGNNIGTVDFIFHEVIRQESVDFYSALKTSNPDHVATVKHIVADGDYVAVHWHYSETPENEFLGTARVDLYKLTEGQIIDHKNNVMTPNESTGSGNSVFSDLYDYGNTQPNNDVAVEESNKVMVTDFYEDLFTNGNIALIDALVDPNYLQHNFWVPNGSEALRAFVSGGVSPVNVSLTLAEDDMVWTFILGENINLVDLWRVDNNTNKIVEHWDIFNN